MSLGGPRHGAPVWCLGRVPKHRNLCQEVEGLLFRPKKLSVGAYFELLFLGCGFLIHLSNRSDSPRFRAPWKKILEKYGTQQEPPLFKGHPFSLFIFPTGPTALNFEPCGRRYIKNMGHNRNILHTLKKEPLNIMLLHTSRTRDGPWIKTVPIASRIFDVSSSTGTCWKDELGNHTLGTKAQNMHQVRVLVHSDLPMVPSPYYSRAIHCPANMEKYYGQWFLLKSV